MLPPAACLMFRCVAGGFSLRTFALPLRWPECAAASGLGMSCVVSGAFGGVRH